MIIIPQVSAVARIVNVNKITISVNKTERVSTKTESTWNTKERENIY